jgi:hypothetical protein
MEWPTWHIYVYTEYNIRTDLKEMEYESMYVIHLAQDRDQGHTVVNTVMNPRCRSLSLSLSLSLKLVTSFHNATVSSLRRLCR